MLPRYWIETHRLPDSTGFTGIRYGMWVCEVWDTQTGQHAYTSSTCSDAAYARREAAEWVRKKLQQEEVDARIAAG